MSSGLAAKEKRNKKCISSQIYILITKQPVFNVVANIFLD